ncbi:HNH endonuclease [Colwellia sp. RE-S-Sl-9]
MTNINECAYCESVITKENDSREHIIPNSIGGKQTVCGFICKDCNNSLGNSWDFELSERLKWFTLALGVKRDRVQNKNQSMAIKTKDGTNLNLTSEGVLTPQEPFFESTPYDNKVNIRMLARTEHEAKNMWRGVKNKYPQSDVGEPLKIQQFKVNSPHGINLSFNGVNLNCSVVKTALAMCFNLGIKPRDCEVGIKTLKNTTGSNDVCSFYINDVVLDRPHGLLFHLVALRGDSKKSTLIAYVEYFGVMRKVIKLSNQFNGKSFDSVYSINPQTRKELDLSVNLDIPEEELGAAFNGLAYPDSFSNACNNAFKISEGIRVMRERQYVFRNELLKARVHLGIEKNSTPKLKDAEEFNRFMTKQIGPIEDYINNAPPLPKRKK